MVAVGQVLPKTYLNTYLNDLLIKVHFLTGLRQFVQWEPSDTEKDIMLQNPKRRKVEVSSTIGK